MLQLPSKSLVEEYKVTKVRTTIHFFCKDPQIAGAGIEVDTGKKKKWKAAKELKIAEERLRRKEIFPSIRVDKVAGKEKQQLLQGEIRKD